MVHAAQALPTPLEQQCPPRHQPGAAQWLLTLHDAPAGLRGRHVAPLLALLTL